MLTLAQTGTIVAAAAQQGTTSAPGATNTPSEGSAIRALSVGTLLAMFVAVVIAL